MKNILKNNIYILKLLVKAAPTYLVITCLSGAFLAAMQTGQLYYYRLVMEETISFAPSLLKVLWIVLVYLAVRASTVLFSQWAIQKYSPVASIKIQKYMQTIFNRKLHEIDLSAYDDTEFYDKYVRASGEVDSRVIAVGTTLSGCVSSIAGVISIGALIGSIDPIFFIFIGAAILNSIVFLFLQSKITYKQQFEIATPARKTGYIRRVFYLVDYAKEIRLFGIGKKLEALLDEAADEQIKITKKNHGKMYSISIWSMVGSLLIQNGMLFLVASMIINQKLSVADFMVIITGALQMAVAFSELISIVPDLNMHSMFIDNLLVVLNYESKIKTEVLPEPKTPDSTDDLLVLQNVSFRYASFPLLTAVNVNIKIPEGKKVAIVGTNGAGKSTVMKLLLRLYDPVSGIIYYKGQDYRTLDAEEYRRKFSVVFQDFQHYALTIAENILMREAEGEDDVKLVWDAIDVAGLRARVQRLPQGIYTTLTKEFDDGGVVLSGGELQKLSIARAYAQESEILIMDEPTSSLDAIAEDEIIKRMLKLCENKTVIFISHKLSLATYADYIYVMDDARVIEEGTHKQLLDKNGKYAQMYSTQAKNYARSE
ncbi:MAG: ABC transporter ATP-binding protein/permease [Clostridiales Family XIII bacterium]|jgi:ATP-binding cassette subfamily B protein|nr:ABC transporter ATP-binding protein/permease [Clostridiales Family XIII bacterium]